MEPKFDSNGTRKRPLKMQLFLLSKLRSNPKRQRCRCARRQILALAGLNSGTADPRAKPNEALDVAIQYVLARPHDARQSLVESLAPGPVRRPRLRDGEIAYCSGN